MSLMAKLPNGGYLDMVSRDATCVHSVLSNSGLAGYEPHTQAAILAFAERQSGEPVFFDIGCHVGFYSALVAMSFPEATCIAFEPTPTTVEMTRQTFAANGLNVQIIEKAVSDRDGSAALYLSSTEDTNSLDANFRPGSRPITVETASIDSLVLTGRLRAPTIMKIDVETLEAKVLAGSMQTIHESRPWIVCELGSADQAEEMMPVLRQLEGEGYCFYHANNDIVWPRCDVDTVLMRATWHEFMDWVFTPIRRMRACSNPWRSGGTRCEAAPLINRLLSMVCACSPTLPGRGGAEAPSHGRRPVTSSSASGPARGGAGNACFRGPRR